MSAITVEPGREVRSSRCEHCGGCNRATNGFVYEDGDAHAIYVLEWCDGDHQDRVAFLTLSLGRWGDGTGGGDRQSFCAIWRAAGKQFAETPARTDFEFLGEFAPRQQALLLPQPMVDHVWHVADHVVIDDPRTRVVQEWLEGREVDWETLGVKGSASAPSERRSVPGLLRRLQRGRKR